MVGCMPLMAASSTFLSKRPMHCLNTAFASWLDNMHGHGKAIVAYTILLSLILLLVAHNL